jgi:hypothetical protein
MIHANAKEVSAPTFERFQENGNPIDKQAQKEYSF